MRHRIDSFYQDEQPLIDVLGTMLRSDHYAFKLAPNYQANCLNCHEFTILTSPRLAAQLNSSYRFQRIGWDEDENKTYMGQLSKPRLYNDQARLSFVAGAYARYGSHQADSFFISLANSTSKYSLLLKSLKQLGQEQIVANMRPGVPVSQRIAFVPEGKLRQYLQAQNPIVDSIQARNARRNR
ncbi:hypothetical protein [Hymenobacter sp. DG25A]|uniref:hypothetical protein n=1 Tax=Hymenobacter sp. DG25A TaxID=1385663 RepID=UPI0012FB2F04|nr:hypothetical protein [Hymenobacter sp. DG25A]